MNKPEVIFFGNGPLADFALEVLKPAINLIFHARTKDDLATVQVLKREHPAALGILASFGVLIKSDLLNLFEPEGILNLHPSLLPQYRGASPIESAILDGATDFSFSIMKLVKSMDAGPVYYQTTLPNLPLDKTAIYQALATAGTTWLRDHLSSFLALRQNPADPTTLFPTYHLQDNTKATFTQKLDKSMSHLTPAADTAPQTLRKIIAYQGFPKPKYTFSGQEVIILSAHLETTRPDPAKTLSIQCADQSYVVIDRLQPLSRKPMDARSFLNGLKG